MPIDRLMVLCIDQIPIRIFVLSKLKEAHLTYSRRYMNFWNNYESNFSQAQQIPAAKLKTVFPRSVKLKIERFWGKRVKERTP